MCVICAFVGSSDKNVGQNYLVYCFLAVILAGCVSEGDYSRIYLPNTAPKGGKAKSAELFCEKLSFFPFDSSTAKSAKKFSNISLCSRNPAFVTIPFIIYLHSFVIAKHTISAINRNPAFTNSLMSFPCCLFPKPA